MCRKHRMQRTRMGAWRPLLGVVTAALGLSLVTAAAFFLLAVPATQAGSGGPPPKYVYHEQGKSVLVAYDIAGSDGCSMAEVSINAATTVSRMLPAPSTTFGPGAFAVVTQWNQCDPVQPSSFYAGESFAVNLFVANSLDSATLTATIPVYLNGDTSAPPAFAVTMTNLLFTATAPAVHSVQIYQYHNPVSNYVQHINGAYAPATAVGAVGLGALGSATESDLIHGEIDNLKGGTTSITQS